MRWSLKIAVWCLKSKIQTVWGFHWDLTKAKTWNDLCPSFRRFFFILCQLSSAFDIFLRWILSFGPESSSEPQLWMLTLGIWLGKKLRSQSCHSLARARWIKDKKRHFWHILPNYKLQIAHISLYTSSWAWSDSHRKLRRLFYWGRKIRAWSSRSF